MNHEGFPSASIMYNVPSLMITNIYQGVPWCSICLPCILSGAACALVSKRQMSKALAPPRRRAAPSMNSFKVICPSPHRSGGLRKRIHLISSDHLCPISGTIKIFPGAQMRASRFYGKLLHLLLVLLFLVLLRFYPLLHWQGKRFLKKRVFFWPFQHLSP